jgi:hypothetical protein
LPFVVAGPIALERLSVDGDGLVAYPLKHPFRAGTTHVLFEPLDFIARLAALVRRPRTHLVRYHDLFAPNAKHRRTFPLASDPHFEAEQRLAAHTQAHFNIQRGPVMPDTFAIVLTRSFRFMKRRHRDEAVDCASPAVQYLY